VSRPFDPSHPEQVAYEDTCSMWLTEGTSDREKHAYRDGHHKGWNNAVQALQLGEPTHWRPLPSEPGTAPQPKRRVNYVCPICAASLERQE